MVVPKNFEGGRDLKQSFFRPNSSEEQKKIITPSDCPSYLSPLPHENFVLVSAGEHGPSAPLDTPLA